MTGTEGTEPGGLPASGSVPEHYAHQAGLYAAVDPALPDGVKVIVISTSPTGTRLHELIERWSTTRGEEQAAEAVREWLNDRVEGTDS
jgi:hypothetical protein